MVCLLQANFLFNSFRKKERKVINKNRNIFCLKSLTKKKSMNSIINKNMSINPVLALYFSSKSISPSVLSKTKSNLPKTIHKQKIYINSNAKNNQVAIFFY